MLSPNVLPMLPPSFGNNDGCSLIFNDEDDMTTCNKVLSVLGFMLIGLLKSMIIGALIGKKCLKTRCCISRHFLKAWCNHKYRSGIYHSNKNKQSQCCWSNFCNKSQRHQQTSSTLSNAAKEEEDDDDVDDIHDSNGSIILHTSSSNDNDDYKGTTKEHTTSSSTTSTDMDEASSLHHSDCSSNRNGTMNSNVSASSSITNSTTFTVGFNKMMILPITTTKNKTSQKRKNNKSSSSTKLLHLARLQDWDNMIERIKVCKLKELHKRDVDGLLPLHWVCSSSLDDETSSLMNKQAEIIQRLIELYPTSIYEMDYEGRTPFHYLLQQNLCSSSSSSSSSIISDTEVSATAAAPVKIIRTFLERDTSLLACKDIMGKTPIWYACRNINNLSKDVINVLLNYIQSADLSILIESQGRYNSTSGATPLSMAWKVTMKDVRQRKRQHHPLKRMQNNMSNNQQSQICTNIHDGNPSWENSISLLRMVYYNETINKSEQQKQEVIVGKSNFFFASNRIRRAGGNSKHEMLSNASSSSIMRNDEFPLLIAIISIKQVPLDVFDEVIKMKPKYVFVQRDYYNNLPLWVALQEFSPLYKTYKDRSIYIIDKLLSMYPEIVTKEKVLSNDKIPLMIALRNGMTLNDGGENGSSANSSSILERLLSFNVDVLRIKDPITKLYPFMIAATAANLNETTTTTCNATSFVSKLIVGRRRSMSTNSSALSSSTNSSTSGNNSEQGGIESVFDKAIIEISKTANTTTTSTTSQEITTSQEQVKKEDCKSGTTYSTSTIMTSSLSSSSSSLLPSSDTVSSSSSHSEEDIVVLDNNEKEYSSKDSNNKDQIRHLEQLNTIYYLLLACPEAITFQ